MLRSLLENYQIKTLSIVNSDGNHTELKKIVAVLKKHKSDFRNLAKNLTGMVHFCCFKSQNNKLLKENIVKIREVFNQEVEIDLNILEEQPLEEDLEESKGKYNGDGINSEFKVELPASKEGIYHFNQ